MKDPVGAYETVREQLALYLKTAFRTQYPGVEAERDELLKNSEVLTREPWIEPLPRYKSSGKGIPELSTDDVPTLGASALEDFKRLATAGLVQGFPLYSHQLEALQAGSSGQNFVVTAGTGSGKTESFLLPLFAYLAQESSSGWTAPGPAPDHLNDWWSNPDWHETCRPVTSYTAKGEPRRSWQHQLRVPQRDHETRKPGVRALVVYPMNALVEDQLSRLRRALDSTEAREWYRERARRKSHLLRSLQQCDAGTGHGAAADGQFRHRPH